MSRLGLGSKVGDQLAGTGSAQPLHDFGGFESSSVAVETEDGFVKFSQQIPFPSSLPVLNATQNSVLKVKTQACVPK